MFHVGNNQNNNNKRGIEQKREEKYNNFSLQFIVFLNFSKAFFSTDQCDALFKWKQILIKIKQNKKKTLTTVLDC